MDITGNVHAVIGPFGMSHEEKITDIYGLTAAQAEVTIALIAGNSVADYAERKGVSIATVRTHVRAIFTKTGVKRQVDLVRLLMGLG